MKKALAILGGVLLLLLVIFLVGPRVEIDTTIHPVTLPADLDSYLAASEGRFNDIVPGAEKVIVWAGEPGVQTPLAIVYLHGFSATRQETAPLADNLAAALGANLFYTRFTGHGRSGEALAEASVNDWLNDTREALEIGRRLGERVIVMGVSTGGTAATWLATQPDVADVLAFVLISPNFAPRDGTAEILTWPWAEQIATALIGSERSWEPENSEHGRYWTERYPTRALLPMMGLVKLTRSADLDAIQQPVLIIYSPDDQVVDPARVENTFAAMGTADKELVPMTGMADANNHVLAGDILAPVNTAAVQETVLTFLASLE